MVNRHNRRRDEKLERTGQIPKVQAENAQRAREAAAAKKLGELNQDLIEKLKTLAEDRDALHAEYKALIFKHNAVGHQISAIHAMSHITAYAILEGETMAVGVRHWLDGLKDAIQKLEKYLAPDHTIESMMPEFSEHVAKITKAASQAVNRDDPDYDDGDYLRQIAPEYDDIFRELFRMASLERAKVSEQAAAEAKARNSVTERTKEEQRLIELAVAELRAVRSERPDHSLPRLREHYVSKFEGRVPDEKREVYEKIKSVTDATLRNWRDKYGEI
jgi:hypothetical protein